MRNEPKRARARRIALRLTDGCWSDWSCATCYADSASEALAILHEELSLAEIVRLEKALDRRYRADFPLAGKRFRLSHRLFRHLRWALNPLRRIFTDSDPGFGECVMARTVRAAIRDAFGCYSLTSRELWPRQRARFLKLYQRRTEGVPS